MCGSFCTSFGVWDLTQSGLESRDGWLNGLDIRELMLYYLHQRGCLSYATSSLDSSPNKASQSSEDSLS